MDDHPLFRDALREIVERMGGASVAWEAASADEAERMAGDEPVDLVLMDATLNGPKSGIDAARTIVRKHPATRVVMISGMLDDDRLREAFEAGAVAYLPKDLPGDKLAKAFQGLLSARAATLRKRAAESGGVLPSHRPLSRRELEVLEAIASGYTNREIALRLRISTTTVNKHVHNILQKLPARNRAQATQALPRLRAGAAAQR